jgi:integrase
MIDSKAKQQASTDLQAKNAKPQEKLYRLTYGDGLQLEIRPNGRKYWIHRYLNPTTKKQTVYTIGEYKDSKKPPHVDLLGARTVLYEIKGLIKQGVDPNTHKHRAKIQETRNTFKEVALEWHDNQLNRWTESNAAQVLRCLELDIFPNIGNRAIASLDALDFLQVIRLKEGQGKLDKAQKVKQRMGAVMRYAVATGKAKYNPVGDLGAAMKAKPRDKHFNAVNLGNLPAFLHDLAAYRSEVMRRAVQFTLLTFARTGSVRAAEWREIDWQNAQWNIPAEHMKMGQAHIIPLSRQALKLLEELRVFTGDSEFIFYTNAKDKPLSPNALLATLKYMGWNNRTTIHGLRALASSILHESGFPPHVIEKQLAHADHNKIAGAYRYMAQYMPERVTIMQWWADFLDSQYTGARVIPIRAGVTA